MTAAEVMAGAVGILGAVGAVPLALLGRDVAGLICAACAVVSFVAVAVLRMGAL